MKILKLNSNDAMRYAIEAMGVDRVDKGGNPYVLHLCEVVTRLDETARAMRVVVTDDMRCAAILHDAVEDTDRTLDDLRKEGFSDETVRLVDALTHRNGEERLAYFMRVVYAGPEARAIKAADALSNARPERLNREPTPEDIVNRKLYAMLAETMMDRDAPIDMVIDRLIDAKRRATA